MGESVKPGRFIWIDPDNGLEAVLVVDSLVADRAAGGIRIKPYGSLEDAIADASDLARAMTAKCALAGIDAGGCKVVIRETPRLQRREGYRRLGRLLAEVGFVLHVGADFGTTVDDLDAVAENAPHVHFPDSNLLAAAGHGVLECVAACARIHGARVEKLQVAVQGAGAMGAAAARALVGASAGVTIADLDDELARTVAAELGVEVTAAAEVLAAEVDILAPCAVGGVIDEVTATEVNAWAICGAANNIVKSRAAERILEDRGILVVPDVISSAGAVAFALSKELMGESDPHARVRGLGATAESVLREAAGSARTAAQVAWDRVHSLRGGLLALLVFSLALASTACSDVNSDAPCEDGEAICDGATHRICSGSRFVDNETCAGGTICFPDFGCAECNPTQGTACVGSEIHDCTVAGVVGDLVRDCGDSGCSQGQCNVNCGAGGVQLIYVVDSDETLYSFDPSLLGTSDPFTVIGTLDCPAAPALPTFDDGPGTPFSMSVDREGRAWVLYTSGQLFHASIVDASCERVSYAAGQKGFELFGMGFVLDAPGAFTETLYIAGGVASANEVGDLGTINPVTLEVNKIGPLSADTITPRISPELTGTGDAKLYGYYPGAETAVVEIHKGAGSEVVGWELNNNGGDLAGWAFAHWGGQFYIFLTTQFGFDTQSEVILFNPQDGSAETIIGDTGKHIVGAGVSTCAPTTIE